MVLRVFIMIATSGFLTASECTKFVFGRDSARTPLGELTAHPDNLAGLRGPTSKAEGREEGKEERRRGRQRGKRLRAQ